jgi:putative MATE family efflux protein
MAEVVAARATDAGDRPKFTTGSILRHVLVMTGTGALGLMAIFLGDLANIFFLGLIGDIEVVAAVGYASTVLFFATSIGIGLSIATTALVAPALGRNDRAQARRYAASAHASALLFAIVVVIVMYLTASPVLGWLGATGRTLALAKTYLFIVLPSLPFLVLGFCASSVLRSVGDARRAMYITLTAAIVTIVLDLILIVWFGWGLAGAAIASILSRLAFCAVGFYGMVRVHDLIEWPRIDRVAADIGRVTSYAVPAMLTNIATPVANGYVTAAVAAYGDGAVAGWAIVGRLVPVAFGGVFALSGAVGPIVGQNYGARDYGRVRATLIDSLKVTLAFTVVSWAVLALAAPSLVAAFKATGDAAALVYAFCYWLAPLFGFTGALFVANALFNTLGFARYATALNWARATIGTIPFAMIGGWLGGATGVLAGQFVGGIVFGIAGVLLAFHVVADMERDRR